MKKTRGVFAFLLLLFVLITSTTQAFTVKQCKLQADTRLEKTYCEIMAKGKGQSLPDFYEFKRNPPRTQILLLRAPAKRTGIELPTVPHTPSTAMNNVTQPDVDNNVSTPRPTSKDAFRPQQTQQDNIDHCKINQQEIICNDRRYFLAINVPVNRLNPRVLSDNNRLELNNATSGHTTIQYLSRLYSHYIEKMLLIGLGDSTVSFTKFAAIYDESERQKKNFIRRFSDMYELLKKERQTMAIKSRYRNNFPQKIASCMQLNADLIVCDNIEQNWVYQKLKNIN